MKPDKITLPTVAVMGVGTMGSAMARRLLDHGFRVRAWDRSPEPRRALVHFGADAMDTPEEAVADASVVLTMLSTSAAVSDVMLGDGVLDAMSSGAVWAQMGTIGVDAIRQLDALVRARRPEVLFVDASVSGSKVPAERGELVVLASGPEEATSTVDPVFAALGRRTLWLGPAGAGSQMKLVLNTWLAFEIEAAAESAALANRFGISPATLSDALEGIPLVSPYALTKLIKMQADDDSVEFPLEWALKDLDLVADAIPPEVTPVARTIAARWRELVSHGDGRLDVSAAHHGLGNRAPGERVDEGVNSSTA
jgi:3-hydroxyisobutyrate dehydrogenase